MAEYTAVSLTPAARDALRALTLELPAVRNRRLTMSQVLLAALAVAREHRPELLAALERETPGQG